MKLDDLDLSSREAALRGGEHGAAIVPGNAERGKLYRTIRSDFPETCWTGEAPISIQAGYRLGLERPIMTRLSPVMTDRICQYF